MTAERPTMSGNSSKIPEGASRHTDGTESAHQCLIIRRATIRNVFTDGHEGDCVTRRPAAGRSRRPQGRLARASPEAPLEPSSVPSAYTSGSQRQYLQLQGLLEWLRVITDVVNLAELRPRRHAVREVFHRQSAAGHDPLPSSSTARSSGVQVRRPRRSTSAKTQWSSCV